MKLTSMAISNIKHNIKNYAVYFFAMCFSVFTTYSFLSLLESKGVQSKMWVDNRYTSLFAVFAVIILIFVLFFLISSNNSFIRARKKEISTYALFGMKNSRIGKLMFLETLALGSVAIIVGIALGVFFSKLITMILLKMTMSDYAGNISFSIGPRAILYTVIVFFAIFCLMGLSGLRVINKFKLVDLFKGSKVSESKTKGSFILLIISLLLIIAGYYWAFSLKAMEVVKMMLNILIIVVVGTYLFFLGGFQKVLYLIKKNKRRFYKGTNLISTSLLSHRVKTVSTTMATIAILVAIGTTAISFGYSLFKTSEVNTYNSDGFDLYFYTDDEQVLKDVHDVFEKYNNKILDEIKFERYVIRPERVDIPEDIAYMFENFDYFGVYSESGYNDLAQLSKADVNNYDIQKGEIIFFGPYLEYGDVFTGDEKIKFKDRELSLIYESGVNFNFGRRWTIILSDEDFSEMLKSGEISTKLEERVIKQGNKTTTFKAQEFWPLVAINYTNPLGSKELANELTSVIEGKVGSYRLAYNTYKESLSIIGLVCFIGFFMCAVFILMTASLLYFKQITIATEEKSQYAMLKKVGIDKDMENKIIRKRLLPIFFIPLLIGIMHSIFAMKAADTMMFAHTYQNTNSYIEVLKASGVMYAAYAAVYTIFYFITKGQYKRILKR